MDIKTLRCPLIECRVRFTYDVSEGWPDFCPVCGGDINNRRADDDIVVPYFLSDKTKRTDKVARDIMDGSERRMELAAELAGVPVSDMAALKITNLNDRNDTQFSAVEENNPVTQRMAAMQAAGIPTGFGVGPSGSEFAATAHQDWFAPNAGAKEMKRIQSVINPIGQAPLPREITDNPNYRRRA